MTICISCLEDKPQDTFAKRGAGYRGICRSCHSAAKLAWKRANPEANKASNHRSYAKKVGKHPDECHKIRRTPEEKIKLKISRKRAYYYANRESCIASARNSVLRREAEVAEYQRAWREANAERKVAYDKMWRQKNAGRVAWHSGNRKKAEKRAAPEWLTENQWDEIQAFYDESVRLTSESGVQYHVDHIEPIQGKTSCGLHVPWNLQVITASVNRAKGNRMPDEVSIALAA